MKTPQSRPPSLGASLRARIAWEVYRAAQADTDSFHQDDIGPDLAYLLGAILQPDGDGFVDWSRDVMDAPPRLHAILRNIIPATHPVWNYIRA